MRQLGLKTLPLLVAPLLRSVPYPRQTPLLRAIVFDFDGILVDSEPLILKIFQELAAREGWTLTEEEYYRDYLALDDRAIVNHLFERHGRQPDPKRRDEWVAWKARRYQECIREGLPPVDGAVEFVQEVAKQFPLAIASGSLRVEIEHLLAKLNLREPFQVLATADDVERSKPHPDVYLKAFARLEQLPAFRQDRLHAGQCLAIEDAPGGIEAAHAAGLKCLALAHTCPASELRHADWVRKSFREVDLREMATGLE